MKKIALVVAAFLVCMITDAQSLVSVPIVPSKEAKKEAKKIEKEGWKSMGRQSVEEQVERGFQLSSVLMEDEESGEHQNRYILTTAEAKDKDVEIAKTKARAYCEAQMAQSLKTTVTSLIEREVKTRQESATEAVTQEEIRMRAETISKASIQKCHIIRLLAKKNEDGTSSVQMVLALDLKLLTIK